MQNMSHKVIIVCIILATAACFSKYRVVSNQTTNNTITLGLKYTGD